MFEWVTPEIWRKMVRAALEKPLGMAGVLEAISFWEVNFSNITDVQKHIRPYAQAFAEFIGRPEAKTEYALLLIAALHTNVILLPADPKPAAGGAAPAPVGKSAQVIASAPSPSPAPVISPAPSPAPSAQAVAFANASAVDVSLAALIAQLRSGLASDAQGSAYATLFSQRIEAKPTLREMGMRSAQLPAWVAWLRAPDNGLAAQLDLAQASKLLGLIYVFLAEALGPVDADRILSAAVQAVEATPAGRAQSPRAFL